MNSLSDTHRGKIGAGLDHRRESVVTRGHVGGRQHATVVSEAIKGEARLGSGFDDGVEEEVVGERHGEEDEVSVSEGFGGTGESDELC